MLSITSLKEQLCGKIKVEALEHSNSPGPSPDLVPPIDSIAATCRLPSVSSLKQQLSGKMHFDPPVMQPAAPTPLPIATSALLDLAIASMETSVNLRKGSSGFLKSSFYDESASSNDQGNSSVCGSNSSKNQNPNVSLLVNASENTPTMPLDVASQLAVTKSSTSLVAKSEDTLSSDLEVIFESVGSHQNVELITPSQSEVAPTTSCPADNFASSGQDVVLSVPQPENNTALATALVDDSVTSHTSSLDGISIDKTLSSEKPCNDSKENIPYTTSSSLSCLSEENSVPVVLEGPISCTTVGAAETFSTLADKCPASVDCALNSSRVQATKLSIASCSSLPVKLVDIPKRELTNPQVKIPQVKSCGKLGSSSPIEIVDISQPELPSLKGKLPTTPTKLCIESSPLTPTVLADSSESVSISQIGKAPSLKLTCSDSSPLSSTKLKGISLSPRADGSNILDSPSSRRTLPKRLQTPRKLPRSPTKTYPIRSWPKNTAVLKVHVPSPTSQAKVSPVMPEMAPCSSKVNPLILLCKEQLNEKLSLTSSSDSTSVFSALQSSSAVVSPDITTNNASNETDVPVNSEKVQLTLPVSLATNQCLKSEVEDSIAEVSSPTVPSCATIGQPVTNVIGEHWPPDDTALQDAIRVLADWSSDALRDKYAARVKFQPSTKAKEWTCGVCGSKFSKVSQLKTHMKKHTRACKNRNVPKPHTCVRCRKTFRYSIALKRHTCTASDNVDNGQPRVSNNTLGWPYFCDECNFGFLKKFEFVKHQLSHSPVSKKVAKISSHETPVYGNPTKWPYFCVVCNIGFIKKLDCVQHQLSHPTETEAQLLVCSVCDKQFQNRTELSGHMILHSGQDCYMCRYCSVMFARKSLWQEHERCHSGEMPLNCQFCDKRFKRKSSLHYHELNHMGAKRYGCPYCDKSFVHVRSLRLHVTAHTSAKPFECEICKKGFYKEANLRCHVSQHVYFNRHRCLKCDTLFTTPEKLNDHVRTEHGEFDTDDSEIDEIDVLEKPTDSSIDINLGVTITELKQKVRTLMLFGSGGGSSTALRPLDIEKQEVERKMSANLREKVKGIMSENLDVPVKKIKK